MQGLDSNGKRRTVVGLLELGLVGVDHVEKLERVRGYSFEKVAGRGPSNS